MLLRGMRRLAREPATGKRGMLRALVERHMARSVVSRDRLHTVGESASLFEFGHAETIEIPESALPSIAPQQLHQKCGRFTLPRPFVAEFRNAHLVGQA